MIIILSSIICFASLHPHVAQALVVSLVAVYVNGAGLYFRENFVHFGDPKFEIENYSFRKWSANPSDERYLSF
jgi:hypothetical protein